MTQRKKYKVKLNSLENLQDLLQELYEQAEKNVVDIQNQMNKLSNSTNLSEAMMDEKVKFAKAMNDFISNKDKALNRKLEIAKLMETVYKNSNSQKDNDKGEDATSFDWEKLREGVAKIEEEKEKQDKREEFRFNNKKYN